MSDPSALPPEQRRQAAEILCAQISTWLEDPDSTVDVSVRRGMDSRMNVVSGARELHPNGTGAGNQRRRPPLHRPRRGAGSGHGRAAVFRRRLSVRLSRHTCARRSFSVRKAAPNVCSRTGHFA